MLLFRKKTALQDLIPSNYVDIHSHLLFGIDDGAQSFEDTLYLLTSMLEIGMKEIITTPHTISHVWDNKSETILAKHSETKLLLKQNNIAIPFGVASEYLLDDSFFRQFQTEALLTIKENYVLVEMSYINPPIQLYHILFELQTAGYKPILAHPERYSFYHNNFDAYTKLKKAGCLFQINLLSVTGYYGKLVSDTAENLLKSGMIDFAGSDIHHSKHIKSFQNKVVIRDNTPLIEAMQHNSVFGI